jgi:hypothetical protein
MLRLLGRIVYRSHGVFCSLAGQGFLSPHARAYQALRR